MLVYAVLSSHVSLIRDVNSAGVDAVASALCQYDTENAVHSNPAMRGVEVRWVVGQCKKGNGSCSHVRLAVMVQVE